MAIVTLNPTFLAISGRVGGIVYKTYRDKIVATRVPRFDGYVPSAAQRQRRNRMREATAYAKRVYSDPMAKALYVAAARKLGRQPFRLAISDHLAGCPRVTFPERVAAKPETRRRPETKARATCRTRAPRKDVHPLKPQHSRPARRRLHPDALPSVDRSPRLTAPRSRAIELAESALLHHVGYRSASVCAAGRQPARGRVTAKAFTAVSKRFRINPGNREKPCYEKRCLIRRNLIDNSAIMCPLQ